MSMASTTVSNPDINAGDFPKQTFLPLQSILEPRSNQTRTTSRIIQTHHRSQTLRRRTSISTLVLRQTTPNTQIRALTLGLLGACARPQNGQQVIAAKHARGVEGIRMARRDISAGTHQQLDDLSMALEDGAGDGGLAARVQHVGVGALRQQQRDRRCLVVVRCQHQQRVARVVGQVRGDACAVLVAAFV